MAELPLRFTTQVRTKSFKECAPIEILEGAGLQDSAGNPAHAATFIRRRVIVIDRGLRRKPRERLRILLHELFHFAWVRLGNARRHSWERVLTTEMAAAVRGEAGWSAEWRKLRLSPDQIRKRTIRWREYCCESFCDTGAWILSGEQSEVTLPRRLRGLRLRWFKPLLIHPLPI